ncbi:ABC transporter permease [Pseudonocardia kunmingensis]|uniref:NitT/TauT family transport system permease protein/taurine transport system permease protein n=1 Tax=Pseudonocardia kunmingensis TaxID=630975 RepID=A0A543DWJ5_9PSEU|nr:ABC transporter permease [Pseudonocardia kunmingensis]TQM13691.1 NitT/TauT family transport system permease protein/taurine transport system permease protein [Pseudonocardia kunmingensis]
MTATAAPPPPVRARPRRRRSPPRSLLRSALWFLAPFAALLAVWAAVVAATGVPMRIFPQVTDVVAALVDMTASGELFAHLGASLRRVLIGSALAVVTALPFGVALGASRRLSAFFAPLLRFSVALAGIAWIPIATLWLGYGDGAVIFIVWNAMFFALTYNTVLGVRRIPLPLLRAARSMGTGRLRMFWEVLLPGALPSVVTGLRVGLGYGWRGLVAAEIIATSAGLGYALFLAQKTFSTDVIIAAMVIIGLLWLAMDRLLLAPLERRTVQRWGMTAGVS